MRDSEHIDEIEMRTLLREAYSQDPEKSFRGWFARGLSDSGMPRGANSHLRIHPLWMALGLIAAFVAGVFVYFSFQL
jgi:hypothetical protein